MTSFSRILRSGMVPIAEAFQPTSDKGRFVADKLRVLGRKTRDGFDAIIRDKYESEAARRRAAESHVADVAKTARMIAAEVDRLQREASEQQDMVDGAIATLERNLTPLAIHRMEKRAQALAMMPPTQLRKVLDGAKVARDLDTLMAAWSENLQGAREAIADYAVGSERAQRAVDLQRDALTLSQAFQLMQLGVEQMATKPDSWVPDTSGARPEERLAVANAGALAFLEVQAAVRDRYSEGLQEAEQEAVARAKAQPEVDA